MTTEGNGTGWCPECGLGHTVERTDFAPGAFRIWCPMCEHGYEIRDLGLMPLGLEEEEEE